MSIQNVACTHNDAVSASADTSHRKCRDEEDMASRMPENGGGPRVGVQRDRLVARVDASLTLDFASERGVSRLKRRVFWCTAFRSPFRLNPQPYTARLFCAPALPELQPRRCALHRIGPRPLSCSASALEPFSSAAGQ